jgi:hypothetical protein
MALRNILRFSRLPDNMPISDDDWRLQGQEQYLQGAVLQRASWKRPRPDWDHDHWEFCWAKFMEEDLPEVLHDGYTNADRSRWICTSCLEDFRERFQWHIE